MSVELSLKPGHGFSQQEAAALRATLKAFPEGPPTTIELLSEAMKPDSPAHKLFIWDKDDGYAQYLRDRAKRLAAVVQLGPPKKRKRRKIKKAPARVSRKKAP